METELFYRLRFFLVAAMALLMPLYLFAVSLLAVLLLFTIITGIIFVKPVWSKENIKAVVLFGALFILLCISLFYTSDFSEGWISLQVKLSLIGFPLLFAVGKPMREQETRSVLFLFLTGVLLASLICFCHSLYHYHLTHDRVKLFYGELSFYIHPSYMAMYATLAALIAIRMLDRKMKKIVVALLVIAFLYLIFFITMLQSKAGILCAAILLPVFALLSLPGSKYRITTLMIVVGAGSIYFFTNKVIITRANDRIFNASYNITHLKEVHVTGKGSESSEVRVQIWKACLEILRDGWITGEGVGDVKNVLKKKYREKQIDAAYEHNLNAHNEFLQVWLMAGIAALLLLLAAFIWPAWGALWNRNYLYLVFILLVGMNLLVESMFETQAGTIFYGFFNAFFFFLCKKNDTKVNTE
ncbi:MAG: O-antigen ligase family protein [Bacteroidetes bacterium]|nr:O-antigen ligase family protein [Bacteroidota bacterium]